MGAENPKNTTPPDNTPPKEIEKPIDFSSLDLWEFGNEKKMIHDDDHVSTTFQNKSTITMGGQIFYITFEQSFFKNEQFDIDKTVFKSDNFNFNISKDGQKVLGGFIKIKNENKGNTDGAMIQIERSKDSPWNDILRGKGIELYEKMLDFLQHYVNENNINAHHIASKYSSLSDDRWHEIFDPILRDERHYQKIEGDERDRWQKTYTPIQQTQHV